MAKQHYFQLSNILNKLLYDRRMNAAALAREVDIPSPTIHRLVKGKSTRPYRSSLEPIAKYFSLSVDQLIGSVPIPSDPPFNTLPAKDKKIIEIPLIEWKDLASLNQTNIVEKTIAAMNDLAQECFAVALNDSSMEPQFSKGTILIFDPTKTPTDRSYILVKLTEKDLYVFRQLLIDAEHKFIKPLNPDLMASQMRILDKKDDIIGTLVEARQAYTNS